MAIDTDTVESPGWWIARLVPQLQEQQTTTTRLDKLYRGEHVLPEVTCKAKTDFLGLQRMSRTNYLGLVVEAATERMEFVGFRAGADDLDGDAESAVLAHQSGLAALQPQVHRAACALRRSYVIVGRHPRKVDAAGKPLALATAEDPSQVITESWPEDRTEVRAGIKLITDSMTGKLTIFLYLAGDPVGYKFEAKSPTVTLPVGSELLPQSFDDWDLVSTFTNYCYPECQVVAFENRPGINGTAFAEFEDVEDLQERINQGTFNRLVAEKFASFRQTAILMASDPAENDEGDEDAPLDLTTDPSTAWMFYGEDLKIWQSEQTTTTDILAGVDVDVHRLASITRTPAHYLLSTMSNVSGDTLGAAEKGLVEKVQDRCLNFGPSWAQVMHLLHRVRGVERDVTSLITIWAAIETYTLAELYDAASKAVIAGVPWRGRMELLGKSPEEIDRWEGLKAGEALEAALLAPDPVTPAPDELRGQQEGVDGAVTAASDEGPARG